MPARIWIGGLLAAIGMTGAAAGQGGEKNVVREGRLAAAADADRPKLVLETGGFTTAVSSLDFSRDGQWLAAAGVDKTVRIWDLASGRVVTVLRGQDEAAFGGCNALAFSPDRKYLVVGVHDFTPEGTIRVYETADLGRIAELLPGHPQGGVADLAFSNDGKYLASAGADGTIVLWDWANRRPLSRLSYARVLPYLGFPLHGVPVLAFIDQGGPHMASALHGKEITALSPQEQQEFVAALGDPTRLAPFLQRMAATVQALSQLQMPPGAVEGKGRTYLDTGHMLECGLAEGQGSRKRYWVGLWSAATGGQPQQLYEGHHYVPTALALSPDRTLVASGDFLGNIHIWEAGTGRKRSEFNGGGESVYRVGFEEGGMRLAFGTRPYGPDEWTFNHYGPVDRSFDLENRRTLDGAPARIRAEVVEQGDRKLSLAASAELGGYVLRCDRREAFESLYPPETTPWCYSFVRSRQPGFADGVVMGTFTGELACFDPARMIMRRMYGGHAGAVTSLSESPDGRFLATGSTDRTIRIWSLERFGEAGWPDFYTGGDGLARYVIPNGPSAAAGIRRGDRFLGIGGQEVTGLITQLVAGQWPFRAGERTTVQMARGEQPYEVPLELVAGPDYSDPLLSLFLDGEEWVLWTPQGYYDASLGGDRLIGWHLNQGRSNAAKFYLAQQFRKQFYRPDVIDQVLRTGDPKRAIELANAESGRREGGGEPLDIRRAETLEQIAPPRVRILEPAPEQVVRGKKVMLRAEVEAQNEQPLREVTFLVNGRPVPTARDIVRDRPDAGEAGGKHVVSREIELVPGANELAVVAANATASSEPARVVVTCETEEANAPRPRLYLLAVGISKYRDEALNLEFPDRDATDFAAAWKGQEGTVYESVETRLLTNEQATTKAVLEGMEWLVRSATQRDVTVLFLSSHGVRDERQNYYLATHEIDPKSLRSTALRWSEVKNLIMDLPGKFLLFVDTCHSGGITGAKAIGDDPLHELVSEDTGAVVFSSSLPREVSLEDPAWGHGAFTRALLYAMGSVGGDYNKDGYLSLTELNDQVTERVKALTEGRQHTAVSWPPTISNFNFYRLGRSAAPR